MAYLEGQLRENVAASEGEHTGYVLEVEVDMSAVQNAQEIASEQVAITGEVVIVDYPERGKVLIFRATSAAAIEGDTEEVEEIE
jgi:adenine-specific DNA methylase